MNVLLEYFLEEGEQICIPLARVEDVLLVDFERMKSFCVVLIHEFFHLVFVLHEADQLREHIVVRETIEFFHLPLDVIEVIVGKLEVVFLSEKGQDNGFTEFRQVEGLYELFQLDSGEATHF